MSEMLERVARANVPNDRKPGFLVAIEARVSTPGK